MGNDIKRKSLPACSPLARSALRYAKIVGLENAQKLHHFISQSPWKAEQLEKRRLEIILRILEGREIIVIIDETGDKKKGKKTDYVKRQYIGNLGKIENGIVSVNAYGYCECNTFPLKFKIFKPKERLKEGDKYQSKPEIGAELVKELKEMGFNIKRVLADSLYGESNSNFISILEKLGIEYAVGIRSNHGVWLLPGQRVRANRWRDYKNITWEGKEENRYIREIVYGKKRERQYWEITTDKETIPDDSTWFVMTKITNVKYKDIGDIYKVRSYEEQGFRNSKNELGWSDFRLTNYADIQKWWELVMSAYLMVCLHNKSFNPAVASVAESYQKHELWDSGKGWKNILNNLQLILQPFICFNLILRWLKVFPIPQLSLGFPMLIAKFHDFDC